MSHASAQDGVAGLLSFHPQQMLRERPLIDGTPSTTRLYRLDLEPAAPADFAFGRRRPLIRIVACLCAFAMARERQYFDAAVGASMQTALVDSLDAARMLSAFWTLAVHHGAASCALGSPFALVVVVCFAKRPDRVVSARVDALVPPWPFSVCLFRDETFDLASLWSTSSLCAVLS